MGAHAAGAPTPGPTQTHTRNSTGPLYPEGLPIMGEEHLEEIIKDKGVQLCLLCYSGRFEPRTRARMHSPQLQASRRSPSTPLIPPPTHTHTLQTCTTIA